MTNQEFSNEFDVLYNNIMSNQAPGLDEYEKSVFLTKAQDEILKAYFDPRGNKFQQGFDDSQRRQIDFSKIVKRTTNTISNSTNFITTKNGTGSVYLPNDILMILNEQIDVLRHNELITLQVIPISYDEYTRVMTKPYKRPTKWQAWKIQTMGVAQLVSIIDIVASNIDVLKTYHLRYVKRPNPIILEALENVTIGGFAGMNSNGELVTSNATFGIECELDPILHHEILQRAVELAKAAYTGDLNSQIALGQNSETNMGIVAQFK